MIVYNGVYNNNKIVITYTKDTITTMSSNINDNSIYNHFINEINEEMLSHGISFKIKNLFVETIKNKIK